MKSRILVIAAAVLVVGACSGSSSTQPDESSSTSSPATTGPTPTTADASATTGGQSTSTISSDSDWITYIDETASFEISYPETWELGEIDQSVVMEVLEPLAEGSDVPLDAVTLVFFVGLWGPDGLIADPSTNIAIEPLPFGMTADEYAVASITGARQIYGTWDTSSQSKILIGDHEAVVLRNSFAVSEIDPSVTDESRWWMVQLVVPDDFIGWTVSCGSAAVTESAAQEAIATCEEVVRTFRFYSS